MVLEFLAQNGFSPNAAPFWVVCGVSASALYLGLERRRAQRKLHRTRRDNEKLRIELERASSEASQVAELRAALSTAQADAQRLEIELATSNTQITERERALSQQKEALESEFKLTTATLLEGAHKQFLERANETFTRYREGASADSARNQKSFDALLQPMSQTLQRYEQGLSEMRAEHHKVRGELMGRIGDLAKSAHDVRLEAHKLTTALRAGPKTRGRWGEEQLRNVVELSGMSSHIDFREQDSHISEDGKRKMPDMVVQLPGGRAIAVDSKVSINAYLDALEAENDTARQQFLNKHADDLWAHVKSLSAKDYAADIKAALDFVVMFVPGENYFAAALEARPELFQDAFNKKIIIATPTTLIAILKSASFGWRQEKAAENAQHVAALAKDLYDSLKTMSAKLGGLGKSLEASVKKYNETVGGFEGRVLPRARKFAEYELPGVVDKIEPQAGLTGSVRALKPVESDVGADKPQIELDADKGAA